jgi:hypothetical protein
MTITFVDRSSTSRTTAAAHGALQRSGTATGTPPGPQPPARHRGSADRASSTKTRLFGVAVVTVVVAVLTSLVGLIVTGPGQVEATSVSAAAAVFGVVGMFSAIAGGLLAVIAAVRSQA